MDSIRRGTLHLLMDGDRSILPLLFLIDKHPRASLIIHELLLKGVRGEALKRWIEKDFAGNAELALDSIKFRGV